MEARIETNAPKTLIGMKSIMSFSNYQVYALWSEFMPRRKEIENLVGSDLYSVEVFSRHFFNPYHSEAVFEKWAGMEVRDATRIPDGMESLIIPAGLYAVFNYKGLGSEASKMYQSIFEIWLKGSEYDVDHRPHFAVMGEKYKYEHPDSEEEIWIPIKLK